MILEDAHGRSYQLYFHYGVVNYVNDRRRTTKAYLRPLIIGSSAEPRCIAVRRDRYSGLDLSGVIFGMAICSKRDQFRRETGRLIALERALDVLDAIAGSDDAFALMTAYTNRTVTAKAVAVAEPVEPLLAEARNRLQAMSASLPAIFGLPARPWNGRELTEAERGAARYAWFAEWEQTQSYGLAAQAAFEWLSENAP